MLETAGYLELLSSRYVKGQQWDSMIVDAFSFQEALQAAGLQGQQLLAEEQALRQSLESWLQSE